MLLNCATYRGDELLQKVRDTSIADGFISRSRVNENTHRGDGGVRCKCSDSQTVWQRRSLQSCSLQSTIELCRYTFESFCQRVSTNCRSMQSLLQCDSQIVLWAYSNKVWKNNNNLLVLGRYQRMQNVFWWRYLIELGVCSASFWSNVSDLVKMTSNKRKQMIQQNCPLGSCANRNKRTLSTSLSRHTGERAHLSSKRHGSISSHCLVCFLLLSIIGASLRLGCATAILVSMLWFEDLLHRQILRHWIPFVVKHDVLFIGILQKLVYNFKTLLKTERLISITSTITT